MATLVALDLYGRHHHYSSTFVLLASCLLFVMYTILTCLSTHGRQFTLDTEYAHPNYSRLQYA